MTEPIDPNSIPPVMVRSGNIPKLYADGLSQLVIGYPVCRLVLHGLVERPIDPKSAPEIRHIECELIMPTLAMIDMAKQVLAVVAANEPHLTQLNAEQGTKIHELLSTAAVPSFVMVDPNK